MIRRPPRSTLSSSSAASDVYKRQNYNNDHPVGQLATLTSRGNPIQGAGVGITYASGVFTVASGTPYGNFVRNYGYPALAAGKWSAPYGVTGSGIPFVMCTTCHNQHVMTVYTSSASSPING